MGRSAHATRILPIDVSKIGRIQFSGPSKSFLEDWTVELSQTSRDAAYLREAASQLQSSETPVAFPTETVYGLGADATRSAAVRGIYAAKQRPSDNPLIVHIHSLKQLRRLLLPPDHEPNGAADVLQDPIPSIYHPLISRFWPGPLTILLPLPTPSPFAPEVTASLTTVAVRMPSSLLALALIRQANIPLAAPSANASSRPSPTTAAHVLYDLSGRIDLILDGGPCDIGVESTVVDGLSDPPLILRPGGVSIDMLRQCQGWEGITVGYMDAAEEGKPRAPGMKYKHYSPKAKVVLVEGDLDVRLIQQYGESGRIGVLTTKEWQMSHFQEENLSRGQMEPISVNGIAYVSGGSKTEVRDASKQPSTTTEMALEPPLSSPNAKLVQVKDGYIPHEGHFNVWTVALGSDARTVAKGLFSALRELDQHEVEVILVEGINENEGDAAAAVMNRLRKAAELQIRI